MITAIVEASVFSNGERVALGIMNACQALALPYHGLEFSHPCAKERRARGEPAIFLPRAEFARLFDQK